MQALLGVALELDRLLAVALDARDALGADAQVRLPQVARQDHQQQQENTELEEDRRVDVDELRLMRLWSRRK